jgi:hypothetical protein
MLKNVANVLAIGVLLLGAAQVRAADAPVSQPAPAPATSQPTATLEAKQTEELTAAKDKVVTVKGTVSRAGWSPRGNILFINFEGVGREGFSAVVPKDNKEAIAKYGEDAAELVGKPVEITGTIVMYKARTGPEKPEIEVKSADQIKVSADAGAGATTKPGETPGATPAETPGKTPGQ